MGEGMGEINMDVSIIILSKNAGVSFATLLQRLFSQKFDGSYEVLVIDSGSTDDTLEVAQGCPVKIARIKPEEFHHGKTRNLGAELSSGGILVYITQDALPLNDNWLQKLTEDLNDLQVAMVVGRQIPWHDTKPPEKFFYLYYFPEHKIEVVSGAPDYYRDNMFISNVNSAIRREVWQQFKFSENIVMAEDKEFAKRVLLAGWRIVYQPEAVVYHAHDFSLRAIFRRSMDSGIALAQEVNVPRSRNWVINRLGYFASEAGYIMANQRWWKWLPYSVAYEASKLIGVMVGWLKGEFSKTFAYFNVATRL
jgi:rhamnosyltransferase